MEADSGETFLNAAETFMFWFIFYFAVSYSLVLLALGVCFYVLLRKKWHWGWILVPTLLLPPLPLLPYARVTWQTQQYRNELLPAFMREARHTISGEITTPPLIFRVLSITPRRAVVYAVEACGDDSPYNKYGWKMRLKKGPSGWVFEEYDAIWSDCGSAEGNTFPPYPEARSF